MRTQQEIIEHFKIIRFRQFLILLLTLIVVVPIALLDKDGGKLFGYTGSELTMPVICFSLVILVITRINWKCPCCNKFLGKTLNPKYCNKCGVLLREKIL